MTFYLKYRPQRIDDLDISSVRESLKNIIKSKEIPHAFLFAGPKGTGKTSTARILAKIINCQSKKSPCNKCEQCLSITNGTNIDVLEMDAASNRGIDDIRALRDVVKLSPAKAKAKIYIIDEAHMLTTEASNALLKTLEEPPNHVYFILATTNPEKLIETIKSRTTLINFTKATISETKKALEKIIKKEKIKIGEEDAIKIAELAKGSFRDGVKLLEQYSKDHNFLKHHIVFDSENFVNLLLKKDLENSLKEIEKAVTNGNTISSITEDVLEKIQVILLNTKDVSLVRLIELILASQQFNSVTPIEELPLQMAVIKWCNS